jgi:phage terminase large subunit GpA-like protein
MTAGVDVQEDRIECEVVGHGKNDETWSIDYSAFMGDTASSFVWEQLFIHLSKQWRHMSGQTLSIACVGIDSGHRTKVVYDFCLPRESLRWFPVKGVGGWGKGYITRPLHRNKEGVYLFLAHVDEIKSKIYSCLKVESPGPGYCHFPDKAVYNEEYFKMLTAEMLITKKKGGRRILQWELPKGRRNEALDARAYAFAALQILNPDMNAIEALTKGKPLTIQDNPIQPRRRGRVLSQGIN